MKSTGIVRRIDDLGRIVIPKQIRHTFHILDGDPMELYTDDEGVYFKKYIVEKEYVHDIENILENLVCDVDIDQTHRNKIIKLLRESLTLLSESVEAHEKD